MRTPLLLLPALLGAALQAQSINVPPHGAYQHHAEVQIGYHDYENSTEIVIPDFWTLGVTAPPYSFMSLTARLTYPGRTPPGDLYAEKVQLIVTFRGSLPKGTSTEQARGDPSRDHALSLVVDHGYRVELPLERYSPGEQVAQDSAVTLVDQAHYRLSLQDWMALVHGSRVDGSVDGITFAITDPAAFQAMLDLASRMR